MMAAKTQGKSHRGVKIRVGTLNTAKEQQGSPFMMYSFSAEPGRLRALNKLVSSCSVKGAISAGVILKEEKTV